MNVPLLALANLRRRKGKATFLAAGIAIGIGTVVALLSLSGSIRREIGTQLDQFGANIVVLPRSDSLDLNYGGVAVSTVAFDAQELTDADVARVRDIPYRNRLSAVAPKLLGAVKADGRNVVLAGVDVESELRLKRWWTLGGRRPQAADELIVGHEAARALGVVAPDPAATTEPAAAAPADHEDHSAHEAMRSKAGPSGTSLSLAKEHLHVGNRHMRVVGVLGPTGGVEDRMIFATLPTAQALLGKPGRLSLIEVSALCKDCPVEDIMEQINANVPHARVSAVQQTVRAREETVGRLTRFSAAVSAVVLAIGALLVFTSMTGAVVERTREIGVLRAIGFRRGHIVRGLLIEVCLVSLAGGLLGWALGAAVGKVALPYFAEAERSLELSPRLALFAIVGALAIGVVSSLYPIVRAARLDPTEAVRQV